MFSEERINVTSGPYDNIWYVSFRNSFRYIKRLAIHVNLGLVISKVPTFYSRLCHSPESSPDQANTSGLTWDKLCPSWMSSIESMTQMIFDIWIINNLKKSCIKINFYYMLSCQVYRPGWPCQLDSRQCFMIIEKFSSKCHYYPNCNWRLNFDSSYKTIKLKRFVN